MDDITVNVIGYKGQSGRRLRFRWVNEDGSPHEVGVDFLTDALGHVTHDRFATVLETIATYMRQHSSILAEAHTGAGSNAPS